MKHRYLMIVLTICIFLDGNLSVQKACAASEQPGQQAEQSVDAAQGAPLQKLDVSAINAKPQVVSLGAIYPSCRRTDDPKEYKFRADFTSRGAAVSSVTLSEFDDRNPEGAKPLCLLSPVLRDGREFMSLAGAELYIAPQDQSFPESAFPLDRLDWKLLESGQPDRVVFEAALGRVEAKDGQNVLSAPVLKITKTYSVQPGSYDLACEIVFENLSDIPLKLSMKIIGPMGIAREDDRQDVRKVCAAFSLPDGKIEIRSRDTKALRKAMQKEPSKPLSLTHEDQQAQFIWASLANKYFGAILRPVPAVGQSAPWAKIEKLCFFPGANDDPDADSASFVLQAGDFNLGPVGVSESRKSISFQMYIGPIDKSVFRANPVYTQLRYDLAIHFPGGCCCPVSMIAPLAFGIIWLMKWMYTLMGPLGNYGIVIMVLVFLVRLVLHPVTKHSQISMMKMQKLGPKMQELQQKYANNKTELNKQVMSLYRDGGVSPVSSMLPMFLQMPIWIALWTAVYVSIDLRGQGFLPFWITDLSAPDALVRFKPVVLPLIGKLNSFNLLPLLLGVVMYLQQKMTPTPQAQANPQAAQQQKIMMIIFPLMFPLMLYKAPSGVNLYIMASMGAGLIEQMVIRRHIRERELAESAGVVPVTAKFVKVRRKKPKPFFRDH